MRPRVKRFSEMLAIPQAGGEAGQVVEDLLRPAVDEPAGGHRGEALGSEQHVVHPHDAPPLPAVAERARIMA